MNSYTLTHRCWLAKLTYIHLLYADTGCRLEDLLGSMDDRDGWLEKVREIFVVSLTWWGWWLLLIQKLRKNKNFEKSKWIKWNKKKDIIENKEYKFTFFPSCKGFWSPDPWVPNLLSRATLTFSLFFLLCRLFLLSALLEETPRTQQYQSITPQPNDILAWPGT